MLRGWFEEMDANFLQAYCLIKNVISEFKIMTVEGEKTQENEKVRKLRGGERRQVPPMQVAIWINTVLTAIDLTYVYLHLTVHRGMCIIKGEKSGGHPNTHS